MSQYWGDKFLEKHSNSNSNSHTIVDDPIGSAFSSSQSTLSQDHEIALPRTPPMPVANETSRPSLSRNITHVSACGSTFTSDPSFEVDWKDDDPENPRNWPLWYKCLSLFFISFSTLVVILYSTAYTAILDAVVITFSTEKTIATSGLTSYLLGLAVGSVVLAPLSETFGRKPVYVATMSVFVILIVPCAEAKSITTLIVVRFFGALAGSAMIANGPGSIGDIISEDYRSVAYSIWSVAPMNGPVLGPLLGGWVTEYLDWRWLHWIILIMAGVSLLMMVSIKESYAPVLLQKRAKRLRKETDESKYWSQFDVKVGFGEMMKVNLSRPFVMAITEPICIFWNLYVSVVYGILYLCFASYPIVYREQRQWSIGQSSLAFLGIGVGNMTTICCAGPIRRMINAHKRDEEGRIPPESMMSIVCIAAVLVPIGELWFAWTCLPASIHPAVAIAAGIPFGAGSGAIFIYASNYLVASYGIYAASALAGNAVMRSVLGGLLPLVAVPLYKSLGAHWAGTVLGLLEVIIVPIPFIFYRYGGRIRQKSALIRRMREIELKQERRSRKAETTEVKGVVREVMSNEAGKVVCPHDEMTNTKAANVVVLQNQGDGR